MQCSSFFVTVKKAKDELTKNKREKERHTQREDLSQGKRNVNSQKIIYSVFREIFFVTIYGQYSSRSLCKHVAKLDFSDWKCLLCGETKGTRVSSGPRRYMTNPRGMLQSGSNSQAKAHPTILILGAVEP